MFGLDKFLERTKSALIGAGAASVLALAGVFCLAASLAALLATWMEWPAALAITSAVFLSVAGFSLWLGIRGESAGREARAKDKDNEEALDGDQMVDAALAMVDLPFDAAKRLVSERPVAAVILVSGLGYLIARQPQAAARLVDKIISRFT